MPHEILLHVDPQRVGAVRMYERTGFRKLERLTNYYSDRRDALLMRLETPAGAEAATAHGQMDMPSQGLSPLPVAVCNS